MLTFPLTQSLKNVVYVLGLLEIITKGNTDFAMHHSSGVYCIPMTEEQFTLLNNQFNISLYGGKYVSDLIQA